MAWFKEEQLMLGLRTNESNKFVKYFEEVGESQLNGKLFKHYRVYQGSSEFDTNQE